MQVTYEEASRYAAETLDRAATKQATAGAYYRSGTLTEEAEAHTEALRLLTLADEWRRVADLLRPARVSS